MGFPARLGSIVHGRSDALLYTFVYDSHGLVPPLSCITLYSVSNNYTLFKDPHVVNCCTDSSVLIV